MTVLLVALGAALGAPLRYLVDQAVRATAFPWGTFLVNVGGSALLGVLAGLSVHGEVMAALGTGFCGALTTYSTFGYETVRLAQSGDPLRAAANALGSVLAGCAALWLALLLTS